MTTEEKINKIVEARYNNYKGSMFKCLEPLHRSIRSLPIRFTKMEMLKMFFGFKVERRYKNNDEAFLKFLEELEIKNPKPVYKPISHT